MSTVSFHPSLSSMGRKSMESKIISLTDDSSGLVVLLGLAKRYVDP